MSSETPPDSASKPNAPNAEEAEASDDAATPDEAGRAAVSEDWAAVVVGLVLLALVLIGAIPEGVIP
ncbi:hypothetical protein [Glycomyces paridis]|uniref:Uncharacterized protein n=1 Tax=Glycomyces paridis TaxID=2126555 RepID=A0A4S8P8R6_9ACTN|nr:hypothetical protein [Glycomyces paridis]THV24249.1 hypothetical protein E9998_21735 [Glycomyces paridis]